MASPLKSVDSYWPGVQYTVGSKDGIAVGDGVKVGDGVSSSKVTVISSIAKSLVKLPLVRNTKRV